MTYLLTIIDNENDDEQTIPFEALVPALEMAIDAYQNGCEVWVDQVMHKTDHITGTRTILNTISKETTP